MMTVEDWLAGACADADRRGIPDLKPLLVSLADATNALRRAGWEDAARAETGPGASVSPAAPAPPAPPDSGAAR
jgi:hypothetical protein